MEDEGDSMVPGTGLNELNGAKRSRIEAGDEQESNRKWLSLDLGLGLRYEDNSVDSSDCKEARDQLGCGGQKSQGTNMSKTLGPDDQQIERSRSSLPVEVNHNPKALDLNIGVCSFDNSRSGGVPESSENKMSMLENNRKDIGNKCFAAKGIGLNLNIPDVTSVNQDPLTDENISDPVKTRAVSECGSTTSPVAVKDPLRVWEEMKRNGFMSSSHMKIPKLKGWKPKGDVLRKKMELAKREQVDTFTKIAAPSELLNGLNPGIIRHVRNRKQVLSIIESFIRSEKHKNDRINSKQPSLLKSGTNQVNHTSDLGRERLRLYHGNESSIPFCYSRQPVVDPLSSIQKDSCMLDRMSERNSRSPSAPFFDNSRLGLRLSSFSNTSEGHSNFSNEESANISGISYLSARTANVASQWLELIQQDIKGRLSALRRSKRRVKTIVSTELPLLISKEFSSSEGNNTSVMKSSYEVVSNNPTAAVHKTRWFALFDQMDKALTEEERQLVSSLKQVEELLLHCNRGLQHFISYDGVEQQGRLENSDRSVKDGSASELAVRAAAASIHSTCSFLKSQEKVSCF